MSEKIKFNVLKHVDRAKSFEPGSTIFKKGDTGRTMFAVYSGQVNIVVEGNVVESLTEGDIFGEMSLIDNQPRSADAVAGENCKVIEIDEKSFLFMTDHTPRFALQVMRLVAARLRDRMADLERLKSGQ